MKKFFVSVVLALFSSTAFAAEAPILVEQPAYHSMKFYVYRSANLPRDWYVTYDGYLVYRDSKGVWYYGSNSKSGITRTGYVVGAVIPSVVRLVPFDKRSSSVAPILSGPDYVSPVSELSEPTPITMNQTQPSAFSQPPEILVQSPAPTPFQAAWAQNSNFMAIEKWGKSVDRIGVLNKPLMPVAWKGEHPQVIYVWTGMIWRQIIPHNESAAPISVLKNALYELTIDAGRSRVKWREADNPVLAQYSALWGYEWLGQIMINRY